MIKVIKNLDATALEAELNNLGSPIQILSIYAINQLHFAWIKLPEKNQVTEPKTKTKGIK